MRESRGVGGRCGGGIKFSGKSQVSKHGEVLLTHGAVKDSLRRVRAARKMGEEDSLP